MNEIITDEDAYLNHVVEIIDAPPAGVVIINGKGFKVLPLTLNRLKKIWPLCERIEKTDPVNDPVTVFKLCLQLVTLATCETRRDRKKAKKVFRSADKENIRRAFNRIMEIWFPETEK
jgi:hypothetical protein